MPIRKRKKVVVATATAVEPPKGVRRRRKKKSPPQPTTCLAVDCERPPTIEEYGFCYRHWITVPVELRKPLWRSDRGSDEWRNAISDVIGFLKDHEVPF